MFAVCAPFAQARQASMLQRAQELNSVVRRINLLLDDIDDIEFANHPDRQTWIRRGYDLAKSIGHLHFIEHFERRYPEVKA